MIQSLYIKNFALIEEKPVPVKALLLMLLHNYAVKEQVLI